MAINSSEIKHEMLQSEITIKTDVGTPPDVKFHHESNISEPQNELLIKQELINTVPEDDIQEQVQIKLEPCENRKIRVVEVTIVDGKKLFNCNLCGFSSFHKGSLWTHTAKHTSRKPFKCNWCDYSGKLKNALTRHIKAHKEKNQLNCKQCNSNIGVKRCEVHTGRPRKVSYKCNWCDYKTSCKRNIDKHKFEHLEKRQFKCTVCSSGTFSKRAQLLRHMHTHEAKVYRCDTCMYTTQMKQDFTKHVKTHIEKPYKCNKCNFVTTGRKYLTQHNRIHSKNPFICSLCNHVATSRSGRYRHKLTHDTKQMLTCQMCPYTFTSQAALNKHVMMAHSNKKCYRCDRCAYSSEDINLLETHMKIHIK